MADHPVAVPKLGFEMAWPVNGDMSKVHFAGGARPTFHYDFMNRLGPGDPGGDGQRLHRGRPPMRRRDDQQPAPYVLP